MRKFFFVHLAFFFLLAAHSFAQAGDSPALLFQQGQFEEARQLSLERVQKNPNDIENYIILCQALLALKRPADAENYALRAYKINKDPRLMLILGESAYKIGRNEIALRYFEDFFGAGGDIQNNAGLYFYIGEIYLRMGQYSHADVAFSTLIIFNDKNAEYWARLAWAQEKSGKLNSALASYEHALSLQADFTDAQIGRDRVLAAVRSLRR